MQTIHNRMPVILSIDDYAKWLDPGEPRPEMLQNLLRSYPADEMVAYPVSKLVNSPQNDVIACIQPAAE